MLMVPIYDYNEDVSLISETSAKAQDVGCQSDCQPGVFTINEPAPTETVSMLLMRARDAELELEEDESDFIANVD